MKPKILPVLEMCVETGTMVGWNRAFKHNDKPGEDAIRQAIASAIMHELYEWFDFEETRIEH